MAKSETKPKRTGQGRRRAKHPAVNPKSRYTIKTAETICDQIAQGIPLREICRQDGFPNYATVYDWIATHEPFAQRIARARELGYDMIAQEALEIADDASNDWMTRTSKDGKSTETVLDAEHVQRSRLRIETRLKLLAKWDPKRYGDRQVIEHEVGDKLLDAINAANARLPASRRGPTSTDPVERAIDVTPAD